MDNWRFIFVYALVVMVVAMLPIIGNAHADQRDGPLEVPFRVDVQQVAR